MKVLLHSGHLDRIEKSGLGKAIKHQMKALDSANIKYTLDPNDEYDILHINITHDQNDVLIEEIKKQFMESGISINCYCY